VLRHNINTMYLYIAQSILYLKCHTSQVKQSIKRNKTWGKKWTRQD